MPTDPAGDAVDEVHSWARRSGDRLHLVLRLPGLDLEPGAAATVRLHRDGTTVSATAAVASTSGGTTLTADAPAADLGTGVWPLAVVLPGAAKPRPLAARLVLPQRGPLALLTGPAPARLMKPRARGGSIAAHAIRLGRKASDVTLRELPPERAVRYRHALRRVARGVRR